jgi:hypothetical protein
MTSEEQLKELFCQMKENVKYGEHLFWYWNKQEQVFEEMYVPREIERAVHLWHEPTCFVCVMFPSSVKHLFEKMKSLAIDVDAKHRDILVQIIDQKILEEEGKKKGTSLLEDLGFEQASSSGRLERIIFVCRKSCKVYEQWTSALR